jgi:hypothetical protein
MLLFSLSYLPMKPTEEMGYPGWDLLNSWAISDGIHTAAVYMLLDTTGHLQMESKEKISTLKRLK